MLLRRVFRYFSYNLPVVSSTVVSNVPATGSLTVTILGANTAGRNSHGALSGQARIYRTGASATEWVSASAVKARVAAGDGRQTPLVSAYVTVSRQLSTQVAATQMSYNSADISSSTRTNAVPTGSFSVTILGLGAAGSGKSATVAVRNVGSASQGWRWTSSSAVVTKTCAGAEVDRWQLVVTAPAVQAFGTVTLVLSADAVSMSSIISSEYACHRSRIRHTDWVKWWRVQPRCDSFPQGSDRWLWAQCHSVDQAALACADGRYPCGGTAKPLLPQQGIEVRVALRQMLFTADEHVEVSGTHQCSNDRQSVCLSCYYCL